MLDYYIIKANQLGKVCSKCFNIKTICASDRAYIDSIMPYVTYYKIVKQSFSAPLIDIVIQHSCIKLRNN